MKTEEKWPIYPPSFFEGTVWAFPSFFVKWGKVIPQIGRRGAGKGGHIVVHGARLGTGDLILAFLLFLVVQTEALSNFRQGLSWTLFL